MRSLKFSSVIMTMLSGLLVSLFAFQFAARASDLVLPDPSITASEVVAIQMKALQFNDNPVPDFGIAQTWAFAHPRNRMMTGPLQRFAGMMKGRAYGVMLNHASHRIESVSTAENLANFDVFMETPQGRILYFAWTVERVEGGEFDGSWMTVAVSTPRDAGQGS
ncbi:DUF4864 domain-containing protein [Alphaproteobacteria bacterium]|jgi:hypothetical protein|nr:DUF4864 domain-containing protein [Alphaproteobacteria bacterium]NCF49171.1 hypothetical protein [Bacteroidota bacterium]